MVSRFGSITEDEILQLNEAALPKSNKKVYAKQLFTSVSVNNCLLNLWIRNKIRITSYD